MIDSMSTKKQDAEVIIWFSKISEETFDYKQSPEEYKTGYLVDKRVIFG